MDDIKQLEEKYQQKLTKEIKIDGIGTIRLFGELNTEALIKKLLEYKGITG